MLAFPIGGLVGHKKGPKFALYAAAAIQALNALILIFITPESHDPEPERVVDLLRQDNPMGGLVRLFGGGGAHSGKGSPSASLLRIASLAYFLAALARCSLDTQFPNYTNIRFGWTQAQSGPVLVLVGLMLAVIPRLLVPLLGLRHCIVTGLLVFALGLAGAGLAPTPRQFVAAIAVVAVGAICMPTLQALLANLAHPDERGALLGAVGSLNELTAAIGSTMYAVILAKFTANDAPLPLPGMHFLVAAALLVMAWGLTWPGLKAHKDSAAFELGDAVVDF